ncbi:DUF421 domain-containing protein [Sphingomonas dokdonensis]|uniref:YetF C-terminal domain-containing protein n=1 Tax=Sphingomonas dokdonensis TaxID=344880 RepID=A0A245ZI70_9SPHN|nr:YetF domain-containing protein [Sphingomonas dokdonensis]OWK29423.1 hypothetical protein SPDO_24080 [Sphingomonas dokdonensis]
MADAATVFAAMFGTGKDLSVAQECARAVLILFDGLLAVRIVGRRIFGKWSALDIVVSIVIGSNLSRALTGSAPLLGTLAATTLFLLLHWLLAHCAARFPAMSRLLEGRAITIYREGVHRDARLRHSVSQADLDEALRQSGLTSVTDAREVTLEPSGKITVLKR